MATTAPVRPERDVESTVVVHVDSFINRESASSNPSWELDQSGIVERRERHQAANPVESLKTRMLSRNAAIWFQLGMLGDANSPGFTLQCGSLRRHVAMSRALAGV